MHGRANSPEAQDFTLLELHLVIVDARNPTWPHVPKLQEFW